jgi:hypothetical protein
MVKGLEEVYKPTPNNFGLFVHRYTRYLFCVASSRKNKIKAYVTTSNLLIAATVVGRLSRRQVNILQRPPIILLIASIDISRIKILFFPAIHNKYF